MGKPLTPPAHASYEAYVMAAPDDLNFREPDKLDDWEYPAWEAAAQAGYETRAVQDARPAPDSRRALLDIIAEVDHLDEPGPAADYIRLLAEYGLGEAPHPGDSTEPKPAPGPDVCECGHYCAHHAFSDDVCAVVDCPCTRPRPEPNPAPELAALKLAAVRAILLDDSMSAADARGRAVAAAYDDSPPKPAPELAAMAETRLIRERVTAVAAGLEDRARINHPSKVSQICTDIAASLRRALEGK